MSYSIKNRAPLKLTKILLGYLLLLLFALMLHDSTVDIWVAALFFLSLPLMLVFKIREDHNEKIKFEKSLIAQVPVQMAMFDNQMRYLEHSKSWKTSYNLPPNQTIIGRSHYEIFPEITQEWKKVHQRALKGETISAKEEAFIREDGTIQYIDWECRPWYLSPGKIGGIIIWSNDVSELVQERKKHEFALERSESKFRALYNYSPDAYFICDLKNKGRFLACNLAAQQLLKASEEEIIGKTPLDFAPEFQPEGIKTSKAFADSIKHVLEHPDSIYKVEHLHLRNNGEAFWASKSIAVAEFEKHQTAFVIYHDITQRKNTEIQLKEKETSLIRFKTTMDSIHDAVYVFDAETLQFIYVNSGACTQLGYTQNELLSLHSYDIKPEFTEKQFRQIVAPLVNGSKQSLRFETTHQTKKGKNIDVEVFLQYITIEGEKPRFVNIVNDIRKRKLAEKKLMQTQAELQTLNSELEFRVKMRTEVLAQKEKELQQQNSKLVKTNEELDRFVYSTSHDLRAPLSSILGLISIMEMDEPGNIEKHKMHLSMIKNSAHKLDAFISEILDYSRNSRMELQQDEIKFSELIQKIITKFEYLNPTHKIQIIEGISQESKFITDAKRLDIILSNIISNAYKYIDTSKPDSFIKIMIFSNEQLANITIEDNGIGIEDNLKNRIFEMFFRATNESTGSGLGLYIVQETIEKLGGKIRLESQFQKGSKFIIDIPNLNSGDYEN